MTTSIIDALQHAVDKCAELSAENKEIKSEIAGLAWANFRLRTQNEELRTALLRSAERTNQATIAAATYKEEVPHAS